MNNILIKNKILYYYKLPFWIWTVSLLIGTSIPGSSVFPPHIRFSDKIIHTLAYMGVGFFLRRMLPYTKLKINSGYSNLLTIAIGVFIAMADELHQMYIPGRLADIFDFVADFIGVTIGLISYHLLVRKWPYIK